MRRLHITILKKHNQKDKISPKSGFFVWKLNKLYEGVEYLSRFLQLSKQECFFHISLDTQARVENGNRDARADSTGTATHRHQPLWHQQDMVDRFELDVQADLVTESPQCQFDQRIDW